MLDSPMSRLQTFQSVGIEPTYPLQQRSTMDAINAVRRMLDRTWLDPAYCERGLEALRNYRREWDDQLKDFRTNPLHDWSSHGATAMAEFACQYDDPRSVTDDGSYRRNRFAPKPKTTSWSV